MTNRKLARARLGALLVTLVISLAAMPSSALGGTAETGTDAAAAGQTAPAEGLTAPTPSGIGQTNIGETGTDTATTGTTGGDSDKEKDDDDVELVTLVLLFGLAVIVATLIYLYAIQDRHYATIESIVAVGGDIPPAAPLRTFGPLERGADPIAIDGPSIVTVGTATTFTALQGSSEVSVDWSVAPTGEGAPVGASVDPATGTTTKLTATTAGSYKLLASLGGQPAEEVGVTAVAPTTETGGSSAGLAFVGEGYGTLVLAVVVLAAATALGILDILAGEALATLFGTIVGYIFVKGAAVTQGGQAGGDGQAQD